MPTQRGAGGGATAPNRWARVAWAPAPARSTGCWALCLAAFVVACDGSGSAGGEYPKPVRLDAAVVDEAGVDGDQPEGGTEELPRVPADARLTRRLFDGQITLLGDRGSACSTPLVAGADRWCAFGLPVLDKVELWVMNVSKAVAEGDVRCDGTSDRCLRLSADIFSGLQIWGPAYPPSHHFEGETLIFYGSVARGARDPYEGPVWAWRPGWPAAEKLTSDRGVFCSSRPPSTAVWCLADAVVEQDPSDIFDLPLFREFDLVAGVLSDPGSAALRKVARVTHAIPGFDWRVRLSADGAHLAYSTATVRGAPEALQVIKVADAGKLPPTTLLEDVSLWTISHDGQRVFSLRGYDRALGHAATGTLIAADFPAGTNVTELKGSVFGFKLIGAPGQALAEASRALLVEYDDPAALPRAGFMPDVRTPSTFSDLDVEGEWFQLAADLRHAIYMKRVRGNPVAMVSRTDGSGPCQLTSDSRAESYAEQFTQSGRLALWIEFGRNRSISEEGWYARPEDCGEKTKFGDYVLGYDLVDDDWIVFEGGDADDSTSWLQYAPLRRSAAGIAASPAVIAEHPGITFHSFADAAGSAWIVYSVTANDPGQRGLYIHGPIPAPP